LEQRAKVLDLIKKIVGYPEDVDALGNVFRHVNIFLKINLKNF
jgi:hypothetical protein